MLLVVPICSAGLPKMFEVLDRGTQVFEGTILEVEAYIHLFQQGYIR